MMERISLFDTRVFFCKGVSELKSHTPLRAQAIKTAGTIPYPASSYWWTIIISKDIPRPFILFNPITEGELVINEDKAYLSLSTSEFFVYCVVLST